MYSLALASDPRALVSSGENDTSESSLFCQIEIRSSPNYGRLEKQKLTFWNLLAHRDFSLCHLCHNIRRHFIL